MDFPVERLVYMLEDSKATILLADEKLLNKLPEIKNTQFTAFDALQSRLIKENKTN